MSRENATLGPGAIVVTLLSRLHQLQLTAAMVDTDGGIRTRGPGRSESTIDTRRRGLHRSTTKLCT